MCKKLCATLFAVGFLFLAWFLAAPGFSAAKPMVAPSREPQLGEILYGSRPSGVDRPAGTRWRIYTVTSSDGKSFTIHGFNKSGYHLSLASDDQTEPSIWFDRSIAFFDQYRNGTMTVGTLTEQPGNVWAARSWFGASWRFGATHLSSWSRSTAPPVLPGDGESVTIPATKLQEGNDALFLNFQTDPSNGTGFLIVGTQKKDKAAEHDR